MAAVLWAPTKLMKCKIFSLLFILTCSAKWTKTHKVIYIISGLNVKGEDAAGRGSSCKDESVQPGLCDFVLYVRSIQKSKNQILDNAGPNNSIQCEQKNLLIWRRNSSVGRLIQTLHYFPPHIHFESEKPKHLNNALPRRRTGRKHRPVGIRLLLIVIFESPYPGKCWRCTRTPGCQSGSSRRGVSAPGSASSWTARGREHTQRWHFSDCFSQFTQLQL